MSMESVIGWVNFAGFGEPTDLAALDFVLVAIAKQFTALWRNTGARIIWLLLAMESREQVKDQGQHNADENTGADREEDGYVLAAVGNVTGQAAERKTQTRGEHDACAN
jgi:hypothetical protein